MTWTHHRDQLADCADPERIAFEKHILCRNPQADLEKTISGDYLVRHLDYEWHGWQARAKEEMEK
ncbi:MAG: hypothetical protein NC112_09095 [Oxalobacter formigenes]|nr:hypothetical protein [Oxalobacter formigenes]